MSINKTEWTGKALKAAFYGTSHSEKISVEVQGIPKGTPIDAAQLKALMDMRKPGQDNISTKRHEDDEIIFECGIMRDNPAASVVTTDGNTLVMSIMNTNTKPNDYQGFTNTPRPGHADFTAHEKYGSSEDFDRQMSGGGPFSGRMTALYCALGGICVQMLEKKNIFITSKVTQIGGAKGDGLTALMKDEILRAMTDGDSVGGIIECTVTGVAPGVGGPMFDGLESGLSSAIFGIPAVKGIEFGNGFSVAAMRGSQNNDEFIFEDGVVKTKTNNCGGILGGISTGMPITFRVAFKPTPSISKEQNTVDLKSGKSVKIRITGRHDPCVVPRAVPVVKSVAAMVLVDTLLKEGNI